MLSHVAQTRLLSSFIGQISSTVNNKKRSSDYTSCCFLLMLKDVITEALKLLSFACCSYRLRHKLNCSYFSVFLLSSHGTVYYSHLLPIATRLNSLFRAANLLKWSIGRWTWTFLSVCDLKKAPNSRDEPALGLPAYHETWRLHRGSSAGTSSKQEKKKWLQLEWNENESLMLFSGQTQLNWK